MPVQCKPVRAGVLRPGPALTLVLALAGCMGGPGPDVTKSGFGAGYRPDQPAGMTELRRAGQDAKQRSDIIDALLARQSILPPSGPYAEVAQAVTEANAGVARAELRVARLRSEAKSKNWLPKIGPSVSLTSLGAVAASILIEQTIFDGGARKAERAYSAADVEVAAASLAADANARVYDGLSLYIKTQQSRDYARLSEAAVARMAEFQRIVTIRADGGLSDRSEQRVIEQKTAEMRARFNDDRFNASQTLAELNAMSSRPLDAVSGLQSLPPDAATPEPIAVLKTRAEGTRTLAEADILRAGYFPGMKAEAKLNDDGLLSGLSIGADNAFGFGTGAELEALKSTGDVVDRRIAKSAEDTNRRIVSLQHDIATLQAREAEGATVLAQTEATLATFTQQYKMGRRPLMELVGMFETVVAMQREQAGLKYEIALRRLEIARDRGVLVSGAQL
ncbi:adhesin transport system outer membrane protein [Gemmobacter caeni]|uniref:Adhesin transport system outer membrane protein n=1 Tax=Gemmobacter caeni TaxID=589035 RepID=A0A2T6AQN8_9RHOB|nr:TolC family protein [Gemmobacter caeni]PTX46138.1 adhesin transport system outer membrane protein [Gemmobacter caeni]TWI94496.1 adhesin transport system outer membrane protein [Gemmobacter caeni]